MQVLPYVKLLLTALRTLPEEFHFKGQAAKKLRVVGSVRSIASSPIATSTSKGASTRDATSTGRGSRAPETMAS